MKKFLLKLFFIIIVLILIAGCFCALIGYGYYYQTVNKKSLSQCVEEITKKDNFTAFEQLPKNYINAVVAVEDHRYFEHGAVDFIGITRAFYSNVKDKELSEGGSTITQQVAKNIVFNQDKSYIRKLGEIFAAFALEKNYSKNEILAIYANSNYYGDGYYGIYDASIGYYNKKPENLTLGEASMLAGIPNAPSVYSPTTNPDLAKKRQAHVLDAMVEYNYITKEEANSVK